MRAKLTLAAALALAVLAPQIASAQFYVLDTGSSPSGPSVVLNSNNWYAAELTLTAGETITGLSAYLTQGSGASGNTFTWDIYSTSGTFLGGTNSTRESASATATGTYTSNGWNTISVSSVASWSALAAGTYWIALQVSGSSQTPGLDMTEEASTNSGTTGTTTFAYAGSNHEYSLYDPSTSTTPAPPVGFEISAVPLPAAVWLFGSGLLGLGTMIRRRLSH